MEQNIESSENVLQKLLHEVKIKLQVLFLIQKDKIKQESQYEKDRFEGEIEACRTNHMEGLIDTRYQLKFEELKEAILKKQSILKEQQRLVAISVKNDEFLSTMESPDQTLLAQTMSITEKQIKKMDLTQQFNHYKKLHDLLQENISYLQCVIRFQVIKDNWSDQSDKINQSLNQIKKDIEDIGKQLDALKKVSSTAIVMAKLEQYLEEEEKLPSMQSPGVAQGYAQPYVSKTEYVKPNEIIDEDQELALVMDLSLRMQKELPKEIIGLEGKKEENNVEQGTIAPTKQSFSQITRSDAQVFNPPQATSTLGVSQQESEDIALAIVLSKQDEELNLALTISREEFNENLSQGPKR